MPDRMSNRMSEDMSDRMPEDLPVRKCINVMVGITRSKVIFWFNTYLIFVGFTLISLTGVFVLPHDRIINVYTYIYNIYIHSNCFVRTRTLFCGLVVSVSS